MVDVGRAKCLLRQANYDLVAAQAGAAEIRENHRRFWLQQAYEKALKAWAILDFRSRDASEAMAFEKVYLLGHSPLYRFQHPNLEKHVNISRVLSRSLRTFLNRSLTAEDIRILETIDAMVPSDDPSVVSYRYPFLDPGSQALIAPSDFTAWDEIQGTHVQVGSTLRRLIRKVNDYAIISGRGTPR
jgi:HEPN domain-containing protein